MHRLNSRSLLALLLCLLWSICFSVSCQKQAAEPETDTSGTKEVKIQYTTAYQTGGRIEGWTSQSGKPGELTNMEVTAKPALGYVFDGWSDGITDPTRRDVFGEENQTIYARFQIDRAELPIFVIRTDTGGDVLSKTDYIGADISLINTGSPAHEISGARAEIRGRGNASWNFEKKSYRINFDKKQQPLGLGNGSSHTWLLMSNHCDQTLLRNHLVFSFARRLPTIAYEPDSTPVEVYLNGRYHGVYLLTEQICADPVRVDIGNTDPAAGEWGFLVERDMYAGGSMRFEAGHHPHELKSKIHRPEQFAEVAMTIREIDELIQSGDEEKIAAAIDLPSAVDGYLIEEYFKNIDAGWSSFYMYRKAGDPLLYFGPFWDFDIALGNDFRLDSGSPASIYVALDHGLDQAHDWYIALCKEKWFRDRIVARWDELQPEIDITLEELDRLSEAFPRAVERNFERWPIFGQRINAEPDHILEFRSYEEHVDHLKKWLRERRKWLDHRFHSSDDFRYA